MYMAFASKEKPEEEIERIVKTYSNMLFKICFVMLCNEADAEDALQTTILKYLKKAPCFADTEHEKAWLIRVAINNCKDIRKSNIHYAPFDIADIQNYCKEEDSKEILSALFSLPQKYKVVLYLFYIGGYQTKEIASILKITPAAVRKRLQYGRALLKLEYEEA